MAPRLGTGAVEDGLQRGEPPVSMVHVGETRARLVDTRREPGLTTRPGQACDLHRIQRRVANADATIFRESGTSADRTAIRLDGGTVRLSGAGARHEKIAASINTDARSPTSARVCVGNACLSAPSVRSTEGPTSTPNQRAMESDR